MNSSIIRSWFNKKIIYLLLGIIFLLSCADYFYYSQKIFPGIYVKNLDLGNKTLSEAEAILENLQLTFVGPEGESKSLSLTTMGIEPHIKETLFQSYQKGRERIWPFNYLGRLRMKKGVNIPLSYEIQQEQLSKSVDQLINNFNNEPQDAFFEIVDGTAVLNHEKTGFQVHKKKLLQEIIKTLEQKETPLIITVPGEEIPPALTVSHFESMGLTHQMASFTTLFDASYETRAHNIELAASILNEHLIAPGKTFSFNHIIGDTTPGKGYKEALIIQGGDYTTGYGGGICQVSSTLYNAALLSNMQILKRHNHLFMAAYVSAGRDAAVSYGTYDLMFRNNRDHYILIVTHVENGEITIALVGHNMKEEIEINTRYLDYVEPPLQIKITSQLPPGEEEQLEGKPGGTLEVKRIVHQPDGEKKEEVLSVDTYQPYPAVIRRGESHD